MESNDAAWYSAVRKDLRMLLISGAEDPVGDNGKGIEAVFDALKQTEHSDVTMKLWPDCRHEVLNELNREEIMEFILQWIQIACK